MSSNNNNASMVADPIIAINDSYDVEESVASSALFDAPDVTAVAHDGSLLDGDIMDDLDDDADIEQQQRKQQEQDQPGGDPAADTSLVEDAMLGVSAPPPPTSTSLNLSASHPDDEDIVDVVNIRNTANPGASSSKAADSVITSISKVPTTITLPQSPDSSTVATPPLGDDNDNSIMSRKNSKVAATGARNSSSSSSNNNNNSHSRCWIIASVVALLMIVAVATSLGILLSQPPNNNNNASSSSSSSSNNNANSPSPSTPNNNNKTTTSTNGSNTGGSSSAGHNSTTTSNSHNRTSSGSTGSMTWKPIATEVSATTTPTASPTPVSSEYMAVAMQVTSIDMLYNGSTPQGKAIQWLQSQQLPFGDTNSSSSTGNLTKSMTAQLLQRYALTVLDFALFPEKNDSSSSDPQQPSVGDPSEHECDWVGVTCGSNTTTTSTTTGKTTREYYSGQTQVDNTTTTTTTSNSGDMSSSRVVTSLDWPGKGLTGRIPSEIGLLTAVTKLDLGDNSIHGSIPTELYQLTELEYLYLHRNQLTGPLSSPGTSQLLKLDRFYAGNNLLTGPFPYGLTSTPSGANFTRHISALSLYHNQLTGPLPTQTKWRTMWYLDLSHNLFTGPVPSEWVDEAPLVRLRTLYLDHNFLNGTLPSNLQALGNGRMEQLLLSDNNFTGPFPGNFEYHNTIQQLELQNNHFTSLSNDVCEMIVFNQGEMVNFKADCNICTCDYFCGQGNGQAAGECY